MGLIIDSFAGGGGASTGIELALGRSPDIAINHDPEALAMHMANHPRTKHFCESVWDVDPRKVCRGRTVDLFWASPDCTFHSKARGGKPFRDRDRARRRRGLAWLVVRWAQAVRPKIIALENVEEFADWGPLLPDGQPCPVRRGMTFRRWWRQLENLGYQVDARELRASDYGAPTIRKRLFVVARCDGLPIVWPEPTHGRGLLPYRTAAECIDWSIPCPSIFERQRPLAEATLRRIARGIFRYVINSPDPFIVPVNHAGDVRVHDIHEPLRTVTAGVRGSHALVTPVITEHANGSNPRSWPADEPLRTQCANVKGGHFAMVAPMLMTNTTGHAGAHAAERVPTITTGNHHALVAAFLAKHNGGHEATGQAMHEPTATVVTSDQKALVTSHLLKLKGAARSDQPVQVPLHTIQAGGHYAEVRAFLLKYYGNEKHAHGLLDPFGAVTTKDRFGLVTVHGIDYQIADIGMRMLQPRELFRAQGFPDSYIIDPTYNGKPLTKTAQVRMCGNSVCPDVAAAIIRANCAELAEAAA